MNAQPPRCPGAALKTMESTGAALADSLPVAGATFRVCVTSTPGISTSRSASVDPGDNEFARSTRIRTREVRPGGTDTRCRAAVGLTETGISPESVWMTSREGGTPISSSRATSR